MNIQVSTLSGENRTINLAKDLTVEALSAQIEASMGVPIDEQKLIFNNQKLEKGQLAAYGLKNESNVYLVVSIEGGKGKKKKKKTKKPKKPHRKRKVNLAVLKYFKIENGKVSRLRQVSKVGTFMADHGDRYYCGKTHMTYKKTETAEKGGKGKGKK